MRAALLLASSLEKEIEIASEKLARTKIGQQIDALQAELGDVNAAVNGYALSKINPGQEHAYEDDDYRVTVVQSHRKTWNPDILAKLVPKVVFKNVVQVTVVPAKIDKMVREGRVTLDQIEDAFEETPNAPYVKVSRKDKRDGSADAESLSEALA